MEGATYARMPQSLRIREVEVQVKEKGFRVRSLVVVTTLLDEEAYSKKNLAALYRQRWLVELDLRTVKSTLNLDILRCQTPEMARKELYTGLLAHNLIRQAMLRAAGRAFAARPEFYGGHANDRRRLACGGDQPRASRAIPQDSNKTSRRPSCGHSPQSHRTPRDHDPQSRTPATKSSMAVLSLRVDLRRLQTAAGRL